MATPLFCLTPFYLAKIFRSPPFPTILKELNLSLHQGGRGLNHAASAAFDETRFVMTFLNILAVTEILCSFRLVLEGKTGKEIPESSRLEFLEKFLVSVAPLPWWLTPSKKTKISLDSFQISWWSKNPAIWLDNNWQEAQLATLDQKWFSQILSFFAYLHVKNLRYQLIHSYTHSSSINVMLHAQLVFDWQFSIILSIHYGFDKFQPGGSTFLNCLWWCLTNTSLDDQDF